VDIWGFWEDMRHDSKNGYFSYEEILSRILHKELLSR
jgi:hypothetical protein